MSFNAAIFLLIFCLEDLPIVDSGDVKISCDGCTAVCLFLKVLQYFLYIFKCTYIGSIYIYKSYILLLDFSFKYWIVTFVSSYGLCFEVYLYKYCYPSFFFSCPLYGIFFCIPLFSACVYLFFCGGSLVDRICAGYIFLYIRLPYIF